MRNLFVKDAELVRLLQSGDMGAFDQLFNRHKELVYNVARKMMGNEDDALDLLQEVFLRAYQKIGKFEPNPASFSTWLYRLTVNLCIDELRKRKKSATIVPLEEGLSEMQADTSEDNAISRDVERQVYKALDSLKEKERAIVILKDLEGLTYKEIAEVFKCSVGRVKSRLHEARQKLKTILEGDTDLLNA
jgi:RNA polymerase sigma-70 factor (ECF subfamily)